MKPCTVDSIGALPDKTGHFGRYGGKFVPEILVPALTELEDAYLKAKSDPAFQKELNDLLQEYSGRPTPLTFANRLTAKLGGAKIYLKREDLNHTGAHKINNTLGQILLAKRMAKKRIIAETGAGQHGVAVATVTAKMGLQCVIYICHPIANGLVDCVLQGAAAGGYRNNIGTQELHTKNIQVLTLCVFLTHVNDALQAHFCRDRGHRHAMLTCTRFSDDAFLCHAFG